MGHYDSCREAEERIERRKTSNLAAGTKVGDGRMVTHDKDVTVRRDPIKIDGPVQMELKATSFQFSLSDEDMIDALRPYIHERLKGLPSHHFIQLVPAGDGGINFNVVVPEKQ